MTFHLDSECIPYKKKREAAEKAQGRQTLLTQAVKPEASIAIDRLTARQAISTSLLVLDFYAALIKPSYKIPSTLARL
jgi:hypothetical protein